MISIVIPVYNMEKYIRRCLDSVISQTYTNLEIILIDDGSKDLSPAICDEYANRDTRIKVIHKQNEGVSIARNIGLKACTGNYVAFVDSDDYIMPDMYRNMLKCLKDNKVEICVCQWQYVLDDGTFSINQKDIDNSIYGLKSSYEFEHYLYRGNYENGVVCSPWNKLFSRKAIDGVIFQGDICDDEEVNDKVNSKNYDVFIIPNQYYMYCQNRQSITNQKFSSKRLKFLDVLRQRRALFFSDEYIVKETEKLFCNIYIEYYFKCENNEIVMPQEYYSVFKEMLNSLIGKNVGIKFYLRMYLFVVSPVLYKIVTRSKCS